MLSRRDKFTSDPVPLPSLPWPANRHDRLNLSDCGYRIRKVRDNTVYFIAQKGT